MTRTSRTALLSLAALVAACLFSALALAPKASATVTPTMNATYSSTVMGAHPNVTQTMTFGYNPSAPQGDQGEDLRRLIIDFPAGLIGNPKALSSANRCNEDYTAGSPNYDNCNSLAASRVGDVSVAAKAYLSFLFIPFNCDFNASGEIFLLRNRPTADPEVPTRLGIHVSGTPSGGFLNSCGLVGVQHVNLTAEITIRPEDNGLRIRILQDLPRDQNTALGTAQINIESMSQTVRGMAGAYTGSTADDFPFLTNATRKDAWVTRVFTKGYDGNNTPANQTADVDPINGVNDTRVASSSTVPNQIASAAYNPSFSLTQSNTYAGAPVGVRAVLDNPVVTTNVPQPAYAKNFQMKLPKGFKINPAVANKIGSTGCHEWAFLKPILNASNLPVAGGGVTDNSPGNFTDVNGTLYQCPSASEVGTVAVAVPEISGDLVGKAYIGAPRAGDVAAGIYRIYIYAVRGGVAVKLQGRATADSVTGQVTVQIDNSSAYTVGLPQFNYSKFTLDFDTNSAGVGFGPTGTPISNPVFGANDAQQLLTNPQVCGNYNVSDPTVSAADSAAKVTLTPWSGEADNVSYKSLSVVAPPSGSCTYGPFAPTFTANVSDTGAGKHPNLDLTVTRADRTDNLRDLVFTLPEGFGGAVTAASICPPANIAANICPANTQVGTVAVTAGSGSSLVSLNGTVRMADPDPGDTAKLAIIVPAIVGPFNLGNVIIYSKLRLSGTTSFRLISSSLNMPQSILGIPVLYRSVALTLNGIVGGKPFLQNPSKCQALNFQASITSNGDASGPSLPGAGSVTTSVLSDTNQSTNGCASQPFNPSATVTPISSESAKPTNLTLGVTIPQTTAGVTGATIQNSTLSRMQMTFPAGMEFNPAFASAVTACPTATINTDIANATSTCASTAKVADVTVNTPLLSSPVTGSVYLEAPGTTAATRYRFVLYLAIPGGMQIVRGSADVNGDSDLPGGLGSKNTGTGQISIDFPNLPDVPYASLSVAFNGSTPMLVNPDTCASQNFAFTLTPTNTSLSAVARNVAYNTSYNGSGSACPAQDPWNPTFAATVSKTQVANEHPNLEMTVTRPDKDQYLDDIVFSLPAGLTGAPANAPTCSQALADAANCTSDSQIGTLQALVGSGATTAALNGTLHNTVAPINAPAKFTAILNVNLGPFSLGKLSLPVDVALRASDYGLDATVSNLPTRFEGIRVRYRQIAVNIDGMASQGTVPTGDDLPFLNNPSKCGVNTFSASLSSTVGNDVVRTSNYTTTGCPISFGTPPTFSATPTSTESQAPTGLDVTVTSAATNPTIKRVRVQMPPGMTINPAVGNNGANTTCSTALINAGGSGCPAESDVGDVSIQTPLLAGTFNGQVYLEQPGATAATRYRLALIVPLPGQNLIIRGNATVDGGTDGAPSGLGSTDSGTGQVVADFDNIPDLAFSNMTLNLSGGTRALLINPPGCASQTINGQITPNSGGATASSDSTYSTTLDCSPGFTPDFSAVLSSLDSGANADLTLSVSNPGKSRQLREFNVHLPVGLVADTVSTPRCSQANANAGNCVPANAVGVVTTSIGNSGEPLALNGTINNVTPDSDEPARLQAVIPVVVGPYNLGKLSVPITTQLRSDLGIDTATTLPTKYEGIEVRIRSLSVTLLGNVGGTPFMINPSKCQASSIDADMISADAVTVSDSEFGTITGCPRNYVTPPTFDVTPSTTETAKPVGLTFDIGSSVTNPTTEQIAITFPDGLEINPAVANGPLTACTTAQINAGGAACVGTGSELGSVALDTPLLPGTQNGFVFLEEPGSTATTRYKIALVVQLPGADLIVRGAVNVDGSTTITPGGTGAKDSGTGQVTTAFSGIPDLGFNNINVAFDSGPQALFANKRACATTDFEADFTPHSAGAVSSASDSYTSTADCADTFAPTFDGGVSTQAAAGNPDVDLQFARPEKDKNLRDLTISLPTGLVAATTATTRCAQATAAAGNCASGQAVGSVTAGIGTGTESLSLSGSVYNVQPNGNEPARLSVMMPVVVGPFDLGKLTVPIGTSLRADYGVDATAQLPVRYEGIAVRIRTLDIELSGQVSGNDFMINPSKCQSNAVEADMTSDGGSPSTVSDSWSYTTTGCPLGFGTAPTISVTPDQTVAGNPVGLTVAVNSNANNPTIKRVQLEMPAGLEINPAFANGLAACSTADINADNCNPADAIADVTMTTHLLGSSPTGKVYLETPGTTATDRYRVAMIVNLPGRVLIVRGAITINGSTTIPGGGTGSIDTGNGQITADFDNIPDLGFTNLTMTFDSGDQAMVVNPSTCSAITFQGTITPHSGGAPGSPTSGYTPTACSSVFTPAFTASVSDSQAAGHPNLTLSVTNADKNEQLRNLTVQLPVGLVANTTATPSRCSQVNAAAGNCLAAEEVGSFATSIGSGNDTYSLTGGKIYNVVPNSNEPARLQAVIDVNVGPFALGKLSIPINTSLRADLGVDATTQLPLRYEGIAVRIRTMQIVLNGMVGGEPFMTNPSKCQSNTITGQMTSAQSSNDSDNSTFITTGCASITSSYSPSITASANPNTAGDPTALTFGVDLPQESSTTNRVQMTLPVGMEISPGVGDGLVACSAAQINAGGAACVSGSSNLGSVELTTPLLPGTQSGNLFLETPGATASDRYKMALVIHLPGRDLIVRGGALVNGSSNLTGGLGAKDTGNGQVIADFPNLPDLGFTNMTVAFNSGTNKLLVNPKTCATHTVNASITPNSGVTPATPSTTFDTVNGSCDNTAFSPSFTGSLSNSASASNPDLNLQISNPNGSQELKSFAINLPEGLVAFTTGVPRCSQVDANAGNCISTNEVGTVTTSIGSGTESLDISGTIYNVTPNSNQPARLQAVVPVMVGPFDLGKLSIPVPTTLNSDLTVTASASLPSRYEGIAVRVRGIDMTILGEPNGNKFMVAPTKCGSSNISATLTSDTSNSSTLDSAINVTGCPTNFGASPAFSVTPDTTVRTKPVNLTFGVTSAANNPTIGRVQVSMPLGMEINPGFANNLTACSSASIDAGGSTCPATSQIGTVSLKTQLLDPTTAYTGNVYLETPGDTAATRYKIALIVDLPGAKLIVHGKVSIDGSSTIPTGGTGATDSGTGQIVADFDTIPDLGFTELNVAFNSPNPMLINPQTCTSNTFSATMTPSSNGTNATPTAAYTTTPAGCSDSFGPNFSVTADGSSSTAAGGHPDLNISVSRPNGTNALNQRYLRQLNLDLPIGLVAATTATTRCTQANALAGNCSSDELVGTFDTFIGNGAADANNLELAGQIYNVVPNVNEPARLAAITDVQVGPYNLGKLVIPIGTQLNPNLSVSTTTTIPRRYEGIAVRIKQVDISLMGIAPSTGKPFISMPSKCQNNTVTANMTSDTGSAATRTSSITTNGCPRDFVVAPTVDVTSNPSDTTVPTGLGVTIGSDPLNSTISRFQLALPNDMSINADAGNGLSTCSAALINAGGAGCPASSNQGTVTLTTPLLGADQTGNVYLENPGVTGATRYKLAIVVHLPGTDMILRGKVLVNGSSDITGGLGATDTGTGRITTDFDTIPDLQFTQMVINFNTGNRALLTNPDTCGTQTTNSTITPSSGGTDALVDSTFSLTNTLGCAASKPFNPTFTATPVSTVSGANTDLNLTVTAGAKNEYLRNFNVKLPVGLVADTTATTTTCSQAQAAAATCTAASQVGSVVTKLGTGGETLDLSGTIHNVVPNSDEPARLAAIVPVLVGPYDLGKLTIPVPTSLRSGDYGVDATTLIPTKYEGINVRLAEMSMTLKGIADQGTGSGADDKGFIKNPSKCDDGTNTKINAALVPLTGSTVTRTADYPVTGCPINFSPDPTLTVSGTTGTTAVPTGMTMQIDSAASNPTVGGVVMTMPIGMTLNPAVANQSGGLAACGTATIDSNADGCPAGSKVGSVELLTPLLPGTKTGFVYLETPGGTAATRYKIALVVDLPGTKLIVRGTAAVDGSSDLSGGLGATDGGSPTGRVVATFDSIPDLSFTQLKIAFNSGPQALFTNAETAGVQTVSAQITPQSGGSTITANSTYTTVYGGSGSQASEPFNPTLGVAFSTLDAAANPDVTITVNRSDYTQQLKDLDLHLPPGLVANTVSTPRCSQANAAAGTCAASSAVGSVSTKIGTGADTLTIDGTIYNVIPDASEPARLAVVIPVLVGPYDLGKLSLPVTTQIVSGAQASDLSIDTHTVLPKFYEGVPVRVRQLQIQLKGLADQGTPSTSDDKPFMINPSQCTGHTISATMTSTIGNSVTVGSPGGDFTTTNCANAPYNPAMTAALSTTERGKPVGLDLGFQFSGSSSSTKKIVTTFPSGMSINPGVGNYGAGMTCTEANVQAGGALCSGSSRMGTVSLDTPLLPTTQTGALYLLPPVGNQAATRYRLGLFVDLPGSGDLYVTGSVAVDGSSDVPTGGTGAVDTGDGQVSATFDNLPDLQFSNLELSFKTTGAGEHALLTNPNTCGTFSIVSDMSPWSRPLTSEPASANFTTTDSVASCVQTESADQPGYIAAELGAPGPDFNNPAGPAYNAGSSQPVTLTVNRPNTDKSIKRVKILLPPGLVGSADAAPTCTQVSADAGTCGSTQAGSQIGTITLKIGDSSDTYEIVGGLYNTDAPSNRPAKFTFIADVNVGPFAFGKVIVPVDVNLDSNDYSLFAETGDMPQVFEGIPVRISQMKIALVGTADQGTPGTGDDKVFMSNPRSCSSTLNIRAIVTSSPGNTTKNADAPLAGPFTNCSSLNLDLNTVTVENQPIAPETGHGAEHPTGLNVQVHQDETAVTQATLKNLSLALPGFRLSAPAANGLAACSASQLDLQTCPDASRVGTAWIDTSLLPKNQTSPDGPGSHSLWGAVYLETPGTASNGSDRYKLAIQLTGKTLITIRGKANVNETTGEITTTFDNLPDIPFTDFRVELTGYKKVVGPTTTYFPLLLNPEGVVGAASTVDASADLTPHSGTPPVNRTSTLPIDPAIAKTFTPTATSDISPLTSGGHPTANFVIARGDTQEDIRNVAIQLPAGFLGSAAAVPLCSLTNASAGNCTDQNKVGDVIAKIGQFGQTLTLPGKVYLTEGVGGDIAGMSIKVPAKAGPYDLGDYITQGRIQIRPSDHGITTNFVDVPKMFKGIPTHIQNLDVTLPGLAQSTQKPFLYNASDCSPFNITTSLTPYNGAVSQSGDPYQATGCAVRRFSPTISFAATSGGDNRTAPSWQIKMHSDAGDSTLKSATVILPSVMTVNVQGIGDACPADQVTARTCPATAKIGTVSVDTPLLPTPVIGTIYMAKSVSGQSLPDMLIDIPAPIDMQIRGANSFLTAGNAASQIKSTFSNLPDLIWNDMTMNISGGPKGILGLRSDGACGSAASSFASHSGQAINTNNPVTGISGFCQGIIDTCANPVVKVSTKGAKKKGNKKATTSLSLQAASNCKDIKAVRVSYPKGSKLNKKLIVFNKKKKATKKNLKNVVGKAGTKSLTSKDFKISGSNGLKFNTVFPAGSKSFSIKTKNSALMPSYKTFCGDITKKKYKVAKKYKAALKKCQKKNVTFSFEITNTDGTAFRYNYVAPAGSKFFK